MMRSEGAGGVYERRSGWESYSVLISLVAGWVGGGFGREEGAVGVRREEEEMGWVDCWAREASSSSRKFRKVFCEARILRTFWVDFVRAPFISSIISNLPTFRNAAMIGNLPLPAVSFDFTGIGTSR